MRKQQISTLDDRIQLAILWVIRILVSLVLFISLVNKNWTSLFIGLLALGLMFSPYIIHRQYKIILPIEFELIIASFVFAGFTLGEVGDAYERFWWWDLVLHTSSGLIFAFAGFLVLYIIHQQNKLQTSPFLIAFLSFCVGLAIGAAWEIFEFFMDTVFGLNMQKSGLIDTMWDLVVDAVGALAVATAGYYYIKGERHGLVGRFISNFLSLNPQLKGKKRD